LVFCWYYADKPTPLPKAWDEWQVHLGKLVIGKGCGKGQTANPCTSECRVEIQKHIPFIMERQKNIHILRWLLKPLILQWGGLRNNVRKTMKAKCDEVKWGIRRNAGTYPWIYIVTHKWSPQHFEMVGNAVLRKGRIRGWVALPKIISDSKARERDWAQDRRSWVT
jgi:hypothetical protein